MSRRADGRFGHDDPMVCTQPINNSYIYLTCIPKRPTRDEHPYEQYQCMWVSIDDADMDFTSRGKERKEGVLRPLLIEDLSSAVVDIRKQTQPYLRTKEGLFARLLAEFDTNMTVTFQRVTTVSMTLRDLRRGLVELQRNWLSSVAVLDYVETFSDRMTRTTGDVEPLVEHRMGAFMWNDHDVHRLFRAGLPVYYIRPYNVFDRQVMRSFLPLEKPRLCLLPATPPYPVTLVNSQAGCDEKFASIRSASISCFNTTNPFENIHIKGAYDMSITVPGPSSQISAPSRSRASVSSAPATGPIRSPPSRPASSVKPYPNQRARVKKPAKNPPQPQLDPFEDLPDTNSLIGPVVAAWKQANRRIDVNHASARHPPGRVSKATTIVPDVGVIFGSADDARHKLRLSQWSHIREPWLERCKDSRMRTEAPSSRVWKNILGISLTGRWRGDRDPKSASEVDQKMATELLEETLSRYSPGLPQCPASFQISPDTARSLVHELTLINFRYQLRAVDKLADTSVPKPSADLTVAELHVRRTEHDMGRLQLIETVFGDGDTFTLGKLVKTFGFAAKHWADRAPALQALWKIMDTWPGEKDLIWFRGIDDHFGQLPGPGLELEQSLIKFYVQTYYNYFGHPPVLPRM
ncbi:hypothetical protein PQX77_019404 [Marasmius sp. AFHP31]|nr:hypothetical protein PQX77_019404 [Marasmius sp. AFHP31]